ncbi:MAG: hypothetical protein LBV78_18130 [Kitasatospora sp.]|nr:hypothetical protein [Kitasatospora sp.]
MESPRAYAEAGISVHLLIDRQSSSVLVHSDPAPRGRYRDVHTVTIGGRVALPAPVDIDLDTDELKKYAD